jgi:hypothetical protein
MILYLSFYLEYLGRKNTAQMGEKMTLMVE